MRRNLKIVILALLVLMGASACEAPRSPYIPPPGVVYYYVTPSSTFLRDCASYDCGIVADVFSGDRVALLARNEFGWSSVRLERSGLVGWIPSELLSLSPLPATYFVAVSNVYLRECADYNCRSLELLYRGDRVEKIDQDYRGWWRVTSLKSRKIGWIPVAALSSRPGPPYFYVAVTSLALRNSPGTGSRVLLTLSLNHQVEMLGTGPGGWANVRDMRTGTIGWVASRYLESFPVSHARPAPKRKAPAKKGAPPEPEEPAPKAPSGPKAM